MKEYTKIDTIFKRDIDGTKKLIVGDFRNEAVEFLQDSEWVFTEKIDGTNIGIVWDGHKVSYQGRTERANIPARLMNKLIKIFGTNEAEEMFEQTFGEKNVVLFGEGYGPKIQNGGNYSSTPSFILFDVLVDDVWLKRDAIVDIAKTFGIEVVPIVCVGTIKDGINFVKSHPLSAIAEKEMFAEGVVGKPAYEFLDRLGKRVIVKIKYRDFMSE